MVGGVNSQFGLGSFQTEADGVMFEVRPGSCETESGGALSEVAKSDDFPVLERLEPRHFRRVLHPRRPAVGSDRASVILHESQSCCTTRTPQNSQTHSLKSHACSLHDVHDARRVQNSMNSVGDGVLRGRCVCVPGGTKSPSTRTRCGVRRLAVDELAHSQQASGKLHVETWAGRKQGPDLRISQEVEIAPGCAVSLACPSCPGNSPVSPGPGRVTWNMVGWSQMEKTDESGVP